MEKTEIQVMKNILSANDKVANELRKDMKEKGILYINLMSSPGSGKTTLIEKTAERLGNKICVVEGDIQTTLDAERIARHGIKAYQINTGLFGGDCHLESAWIRTAIDEMNPKDVDILFVENIGNLVCPAEFDVGAHMNGVLLSVTEGEDKPLKYPLVFRTSAFCVITKTDLLPYLDISMDDIRANIKKVNPQMQIIELSCKNEEGIDAWIEFLKTQK